MSLLTKLALGAIVLSTAVLADVTKLQSVFTVQNRADTGIFGSAVVTQNALRQVAEITGAFGESRKTPTSRPMYTDSSVRMESAAELLITAAALKLVADSNLVAIDQTIPSQLLPRAAQFVNPSFGTTALTLKMLMQHTSTFSDAKFATWQKTSPDPVVDLRTFVEGYFLTTVNNQFTVASDVWHTTSIQPGTAAAYQYAKVNIAMLAYIVDQAIVANPTLVSGTSKTVLGYIQEKIIAEFGMSNTFIRNVDGSFPTSSNPSGGVIYTNAVVQDLTVGSVAVTTTATHPAYFSAFMTYSSAADMAKLVRALFLETGTNWATVGTTMKANTISLASVTNKVRAQVGQGLGIFTFDGAQICADGVATGVITKCPLTTTSTVWGTVAVGEFSQVGVFCADTGSVTCVTTTHSFLASSGTQKSYENAMAMAGTSVQLAVGDATTITTTTSANDSNSNLYGLWVFFGVLGVLLFVMAAAYFTEFVIQPAPITSGVPVPAAMTMGPGDDNDGRM